MLKIEAEKIAENLREDTFLNESLSIVIFETVYILESELIFFFLLFSKEDKTTAL